MNLIAIDPGANGGIAWHDGEIVRATKMPESPYLLAGELSEISRRTYRKVYVENVGKYVPGNSGPASVKFARHVGNIEGILAALGISYDFVAPTTWMKSFLTTVPKDKKQRKHAIRDKAQRLFPHLKVTLATSDALGILCYATEKERS